jgi:hypothetical protein
MSTTIMPGFTAEAACYRSGASYDGRGATGANIPHQWCDG